VGKALSGSVPILLPHFVVWWPMSSRTVKLPDCLYRIQTIYNEDLVFVSRKIERLVIYCNGGSHFSLLVFDLTGSQTIHIYDGANYAKADWKSHAL
jgi:hypothetical protein